MASPEQSRAALIVVDMQEDFCPPSGSLAIEGGRDLAHKINELLDLPGFALRIATRDFHPRDHISFASQHESRKVLDEHVIKNPENDQESQTISLWPDHCVQGTPGCELIPELKHDRIMLTIDKGQDRRVESYSAFGPPFRSPRVGTSDLHKVLKEAGITHVFTVGLAYDYCVRSTAIDAAEHGFKTFVIEDASNPVARKPADKERTRQEYQDGGVAVIRSDSAELDFVR